jgi:ketosteroid isomerase-like protein
MKRALVLLAVILGGIACERQLGFAERARIEQIIRGRVDEWVRLMNNRDADSLARFYHAGAARQGGVADSGRFNYVVDDVIVDVVDPRVAITTFRGTLDRELDAERVEYRRVGTIVWVLDQGGAWRIRAEHISPAR